MYDTFIGIIMPFAGNFAPRGWHFCDGSLLPISEYEALFTIIGTTYGGDGVSTFAVPDLRGRIAIGPNNNHTVGQTGGAENVTLNINQIPAHNHSVMASNTTATQDISSNATFALLADKNPNAGGNPQSFTDALPDTALIPQTINPSGSSQPHDNMQPYLVCNYVIALEGIFPSQS